MSDYLDFIERKRTAAPVAGFDAGEASVWSILTEKRESNDEMRAQMRAAVRRRAAKEATSGRYVASVPMRIPGWLTSEVSK